MQANEQEIRDLLEPVLPLVNLDDDYLFSELDSLGITAALMTLGEHFHIQLDHSDVTPRNFHNVASLTALVNNKLVQA